MKNNLSLRWKILLWAVGVVIAIMIITGAGTILLVRAWLISDLSTAVYNESMDVMRSISFEDDRMTVSPEIEWEEFHHHDESETPIHILLLDGSRNVVYTSRNTLNMDITTVDLDYSQSEPVYTTAGLEDQNWRFITQPVINNGVLAGWIIVFISLERLELTITRLIQGYGIGFTLLFFLVVITTRFWVRQTLNSIQAISLKARSIQTQNLNERIPLPPARDEIYHLGQTLNGMLDRIEDSFTTTRRFFNSASHEVKTPLAIITAQLERLRQKSGAIGINDLEQIDYEVNRISKIIDDLGIIARADYTGTVLKKESLWLNDLVYDEIGRFKARAVLKNVDLNISEIPSARISGDENWIRILLSNLLDNAIKFTPENSRVEVSYRSRNGEGLLSITDDGPGVNPEEIHHLTKRFFRSSEVQQTTGSGLGLSIAQWVAEKHGGTLEFNNNPNRGFTVIWKFPAEL